MKIKKVTAESIVEYTEPISTVTTAGNKIYITKASFSNTRGHIRHLANNEYINLNTGEIRSIEHHNGRKANKSNLYRTFRQIRAILDANITDSEHTLAVTLTYNHVMRDTAALSQDLQKFIKKIRRYCKANKIEIPEYIAICEPQATGSWHFHCFLIWNSTCNPFIPHSVINSCWNKGATNIRRIDDITNLGAYYTFSLANLSIDATRANIGKKIKYEKLGKDVKTIQIQENGKAVNKWLIKGERLNFYPSNFNILRTSRNIKRPIVERLNDKELEDMLKNNHASKVYDYGIQVLSEDDGKVINNIIKEFYTTI